MISIERTIQLPAKQSFFLFGPRQTGKSTLIQSRYTRAIWTVNLLLTDPFFAYSKDPSLFRRQAVEQIRSRQVRTIFVDEIQRVPLLLNEIQALMDEYGCQFILTSSSARKLKRGGANLLGGRAIERHLFPFVHDELSEGFQLDDAMHFGTLPALYGKPREEKIDILTSYVNIYLREEIQAEGVVRNLGGFSRFLDIAASQSGEQVSYSATARECGLPIKTVQSYYEILDDTLIGLRLPPWRRSLRKRLTGHPKMYLFDIGVTNALNKRLRAEADPVLRGRLFEQFIVLETHRLIQYRQREAQLFFWRTHHGAEVDLVIEQHGRIAAAIEIKATASVGGNDFSGLRAFREEHPKTPCLVVCLTAHAYETNGYRILPWKTYFKEIMRLVG